jgi:hypothetical protein
MTIAHTPGHVPGHTPECQARLDARADEIAAYRANWPNHCKACHGWGGGYTTYDPSPSGVTLGHGVMHDFDTCAACVDKGLCPRCGEELSSGWSDLALRTEPPTTHCPACRWRDDETLGCPEPPECLCWVMAPEPNGPGVDEPPPPEYLP